jgi:methyl-accepting chemotaxis protein
MMNWFQNFSISKKLIFSFLLISIVSLISGYYIAKSDSSSVIILFSALIVFSVIVVMVNVSGSIVKPVEHLLTATAEVIKGNNDYVDPYLRQRNQNKDEIAVLINSVIAMKNSVMDKSHWYHSILDNIPIPLQVLDTDLKWSYFNKSAETVMGKKSAEWKGKPCSNWGAPICNTEKCGTKCMLEGRDVPMFEQAGREWKVMPSKIIDRFGKHVGNVELMQDVTKDREKERYLEKCVHNLMIEMEKFSVGDLTVSAVKEKEDTIGQLYDAFNKAINNIHGLVTQVHEAVQATASAGSQISSSSEELAAGAQQQSSQTMEVASAVEQMTKTILHTSTNASLAADKSKNSGSIALEGGKVVKETIESMNHIAEVVERASATVQELGNSSNQIGEIIQVIDDIADQTNLLALNAAIEAARAGEQGRGFAVVADEVRKLAERTTKATKEIAAMITKIQHDTAEAVESMEKGTIQVKSGRELTYKAESSLKEIITSVNETLGTVSEVASASEEQSSAAEQISKSIESISSVTQEAAQGTQQIARATEDLNRLTENLLGLVGQFKLSNERKKTADSGTNRLKYMN